EHLRDDADLPVGDHGEGGVEDGVRVEGEREVEAIGRLWIGERELPPVPLEVRVVLGGERAAGLPALDDLGRDRDAVLRGDGGAGRLAAGEAAASSPAG